MTPIGTIAALHRYPVKSMRGESLKSALVDERGLKWDRGYAVFDAVVRRAASAKMLDQFPGLLDFGARFLSDPDHAQAPPAVEVTLPDGRIVDSEDPACAEILSSWFGRPTEIGAVDQPVRPAAGRYAMPGTFFDYAALHLLTDVSLASLAARMPRSQITHERFRPNVLIACGSTEAFPENAWIGRTIRLGAQVQAKVSDPCPRCVMPTLRQANLPKDAKILKAIATANTIYTPVLESDQPCLGAYAFVVRRGALSCGDSVWLE